MVTFKPLPCFGRTILFTNCFYKPLEYFFALYIPPPYFTFLFCPENALTLSNDIIQLDPGKCIGCGECYTACRYDAISFNWAESDATFQEKMVEHALGAVINHSEKMIYINFVNKLSKHCDCWGEDNPVLYPDVGILASYDPVAIDRASYDMAQKVLGKDIFKELWPEIDATVQMKYGEEIGLGTCTYHFIDVNIDVNKDIK